MYKIISTVLIIIPLSLFSQRIAYGPEIGLGFNRADNDKIFGNIFKPGFTGGVFFQYNFSEKFSLKTSFTYSKKQLYYHTAKYSTIDSSFFDELDNYELTEEIDLDTLFSGYLSDIINLDVTTWKDYTSSLDYFEIPIGFVYSPAQNFELSAGFYMSFLFNAYTMEHMEQDIPALDALKIIDDIPFLPLLIKGLFSGYFGPAEQSYSSSEMYRSFDYGIFVSMNFKKDYWFCGIKSGFGATDVVKTDYFSNETFLSKPEKHFQLLFSTGVNLNDLLIIRKSPDSLK